ncbi:MAG: MATE family efflux transporter, partial [Oscillospiraceae bacterium]
GISFCFGFAMFLLTFLGGDILAGIFESNQEVILATESYLKSCSFEHLLIPFTFCFLGYFNGLGRTTFVMAQGFIAAFLVRIPLSYFLSLLPNTNMLYIGIAIPVSASAGLLMCIIYYALGQRNPAAVSQQNMKL